jgi:hypothetical protein
MVTELDGERVAKEEVCDMKLGSLTCLNVIGHVVV